MKQAIPAPVVVRRLFAATALLLPLLSFGVSAPANATAPKFILSGPTEVVEGNAGATVLRYDVDVAFDYPLITCTPSNPDCNTRIVFANVGYRAVDGTATNGQDYLLLADRLSGQLVFTGPDVLPLGSFEALVFGDTLIEGNETFRVELFDPIGAGLGVFAVGVTILDDDAVPVEPNLLSINDVTIVEGDLGSRIVVFSVALSRPAQLPVTVDYMTVAGTATPGLLPIGDADFRPIPLSQLHFSAGETSKAIPVRVFGDRRRERNETFRVVLSNPTHAEIANGVGVATIIDDD